MWDVVVVGAGLSGLTAARQLQQAGYTVLVVDKSRGLGGRMATRRVHDTPVDHGCRFLQPFRDLTPSPLPEWLAAGILQPWSPAAFTLDGDGLLTPQINTGPYYSCPSGMSAVAKALALDLHIQRQCRVAGLAPIPEGWRLEVESEAEHTETLGAKAVILAIPAPQIGPILHQTAPDTPAIADFLRPLEAVEFEPVITVMAGYGPGAQAQLKFHTGLREGWMIFGASSSLIRWVGLDSSKHPASTEPVVVLHSHAEFAQIHLDDPSLEPAAQMLLETASQIIGGWLTTPDWVQIHCWRYGFVRTPLTQSVLTTPALPTLLACGDWCGSLNAAAALLSGRAAAAVVAETLGQ